MLKIIFRLYVDWCKGADRGDIIIVIYNNN